MDAPDDRPLDAMAGEGRNSDDDSQIQEDVRGQLQSDENIKNDGMHEIN
jgi:hypothetical protein